MATTPPFQNVVKGGKFYHVYKGKNGKKEFRFIRKAGGTPSAGQPDARNPLGAALLDAIGLSSDDNPKLFEAANNLVDLKLKPQIEAIDQEVGKAAGAQKYLSDRMAKYQQMYQGAVNQTAAQAAAGNTAPQLQQSSGNAALDSALQNSIAARSQGFAANAATAAQVAPMRFADQQQQLAQQFQSQLNDLQAKRVGIEQQRGPEVLGALMGLGEQQQKTQQAQQEAQLAAEAMGLDSAKFAETVRHNQAQEANTAAGIQGQNDRAAASLTSQERRERARLQSQAREGRLNREQKERLAALDRRAKGGKSKFLPQGQQNTQASKISGIFSDVKTHKDKFKSRHDSVRAYMEAHPGVDELYVSVAHDLAYDGHISRANAKKLHDRGIKVKGIGPSYSQYKRKQDRERQAARNSGVANMIPGFGGVSMPPLQPNPPRG